MKPFFSVIIPVYNAAQSLSRALNSVAAQHYRHWEIVLVNDGSEDHSRQVAEQWQAQNPAAVLHYLEQENQGLGATRNRAVAAAQGLYCAFLDADDYWAPQKLTQCHQFLSQSPGCALLYHPVWAVGLSPKKERKAHPVLHSDDLLRRGNPITPSTVVLERTWAQKFPFSTEARFHGAEDLLLWLQLLHAGASFHFWPEPLSYYSEEGGMSSRLEEHLRHVQNALYFALEQNWLRRSSLEMALQRKYYEAGRFYQKRGQHTAANRYYSYADAKSMKLLGLRFLNALGWKI